MKNYNLVAMLFLVTCAQLQAAESRKFIVVNKGGNVVRTHDLVDYCSLPIECGTQGPSSIQNLLKKALRVWGVAHSSDLGDSEDPKPIKALKFNVSKVKFRQSLLEFMRENNIHNYNNLSKERSQYSDDKKPSDILSFGDKLGSQARGAAVASAVVGGAWFLAKKFAFLDGEAFDASHKLMAGGVVCAASLGYWLVQRHSINKFKTKRELRYKDWVASALMAKGRFDECVTACNINVKQYFSPVKDCRVDQNKDENVVCTLLLKHNHGLTVGVDRSGSDNTHGIPVFVFNSATHNYIIDSEDISLKPNHVLTAGVNRSGSNVDEESDEEAEESEPKDEPKATLPDASSRNSSSSASSASSSSSSSGSSSSSASSSLWSANLVTERSSQELNIVATEPSSNASLSEVGRALRDLQSLYNAAISAAFAFERLGNEDFHNDAYQNLMTGKYSDTNSMATTLTLDDIWNWNKFCELRNKTVQCLLKNNQVNETIRKNLQKLYPNINTTKVKSSSSRSSSSSASTQEEIDKQKAAIKEHWLSCVVQ